MVALFASRQWLWAGPALMLGLFLALAASWWHWPHSPTPLPPSPATARPLAELLADGRFRASAGWRATQ
ncbi:hypothetical protein [Hymenobacter cellulosilyticus]|uniref:Uncharacterized protein n=1 Tax=Hymenobacter cellulosilyticus TaxID=2932248 RepID=A0A8T9QD82_9BACT|nr:hypothetical protein [Hymenobacter cellulosilyticus]UOQ74872.1 hypothetical protein MUN79_13980 [Hymenobacter cellulosilyticus]